VLSAGLGARSASEGRSAWQRHHGTVQAMNGRERRRIIVVSAAPMGQVPSPTTRKTQKHDPAKGLHAGPDSVADRASAPEALWPTSRGGGVLAGADWTGQSSGPREMTNGPVTGRYRTAIRTDRICGAAAVFSRADGAHLSCACSATANVPADHRDTSMEEGDTDGGQQEGSE